MLFPHTTSRRIVLRPATADDGMTFYKTLLESGIESLYALARKRQLFSADAMFLVTRRTGGEVLGFSTLQGLTPAGHIRSGVYLNPRLTRHGIGSEAVCLSMNYAFAMFRIDKIVLQTTEASFAQFGQGLEDKRKEGVLPDHLYFRGRHFDLHTYRMSRRDWEEIVDQTSEEMLPPPLTWRSAPGSRRSDPAGLSATKENL